MESLAAGDPRVVGEFRLRARLGAGGMGRVFMGASPAERAVAVKVIHPELCRDPDFVRRFRSEVSAAQRVSGAYTAPVVAAGIDDVPPWLVTAFVPGPSLAEVVERHGPLPVPAIWRLAAGLAEALRAIHAAGLVHRDLKPGNVLLASDGPRVIDFGIARAATDTRLTVAGAVVGTPAFMSPEQVSGQPIGPVSDVFSLGSMLAFAATGATPFSAGPSGSSASVMYRVVHAEPDLAKVPGDVLELIAACLEKDPAHRPDPGQVAAFGSHAAENLGLPTTVFWPPDVVKVIEAQQASLNAQMQALEDIRLGAGGSSPEGPRGTRRPGIVPAPAPQLAAPGTGPHGNANPTHPVMPAGFLPDGSPGPQPSLLPGQGGGGISRRSVLIGAGAAGIAIAGGAAGWMLTSGSSSLKVSGSTPGATAGSATSLSAGTTTSAAVTPASTAAPVRYASTTSGKLAWQSPIGQLVGSDVTVANGILYVGSLDKHFYALDAITGKRIWVTAIPEVVAPPTVDSGIVAATAYITGFWAIDAAIGKIAWSSPKTEGSGTLIRNWAAGAGKVYLGFDDEIVVRDARTGRLLATFSNSNYNNNAMTYEGGLIYVMTVTGQLQALDAATGATKWSTKLVDELTTIGTGVVVGGGIVFAGALSPGVLYAVNAASGTGMWSYSTGGALGSAPVYLGGYVYIVDSAGTLHALSAASGKPAWFYNTSNEGATAPTAGNGKVYTVAGNTGAVQQMDAVTGALGWMFAPESGNLFKASPTYANGLVYIGCGDNNIYAIKA
jgi:outer membrane protein assembly factor BamB